MENQIDINSEKLDSDNINIPKRNHKFFIATLFIIFISFTSYMAIMHNILAFIAFGIIPAIYFIRPKRIKKVSNLKPKFKSIAFWIALSIILWSIQMGILIIVDVRNHGSPFDWKDISLFPVFICALTTIGIDLTIRYLMNYIHQKKILAQYSK